MTHPSFSIVVPIIPKHHRYALRLVNNLMSGSVKPLEIIFAGSSQTDVSAQELNSLYQLYPNLVKLHLSKDVFTAGQNRNRGWEIAQGDYISFCDADDLYSPYRLEILRNEIIRSDSDLLIHNFRFQMPLLFISFRRKNLHVIDSGTLYESTFPNGKRNRDAEFGVAGESNIVLPQGRLGRNRIQHGHATVRASVSIRYSDFPYAEDGIFCRDVLFSSYRVTYISAKLSIYESLSLGKLVSYSATRVIAGISKTKKRLAK